MKNPYVKIRILSSVITAFTLVVFCIGASAQDTRLNLVFGNGTALIYRAREAGYREGQKLNVMRGGAVAGTVVVTRVLPTFAEAQIVSGANAIREYDAVVPAGEMLETGAPMPPPGVEKKTRIEYQDVITAAPRRGNDRADSPEAVLASGESAPAGRSASSGGGETTKSSSRVSRRDAGKTRSAKAATVAETPPIQIPSADDKRSPYVIHAGYFYLKQNIPGAVSSSDPAFLIGLDYWKPKRESVNVVYNLMYTSPATDFKFGGQEMHTQFDILEFSINYIWTGFGSKYTDEKTGLYGGFGAGYRSVSAETVCGISCGVVGQTARNSLIDTGIDYHGIVGYRFHKNFELKLDYSFEDDYFGITVGVAGKAKRAPVQARKIEPEPEPVVEEEPEPEPVAEEEPEPEPEVLTQAPQAIFEERPAPRVVEPVIIYVAEPEVEKKVYALVAEPEIEKKVIVLAVEDVNFDFDKSILTPKAQEILKRNIEILHNNPRSQFRIAGYTSASGSDEYNQKLSERRAKAVKDYLVKEGLIAKDRLVTIGFGEADPETYEVAPKDLYSPAAKSNMRALFEIIVE